jgi:cell division protein FtsW (lipid II flippase)
MSGVLFGLICLLYGLAFWRVAANGASTRGKPPAMRAAALTIGVVAPAVLIVGCLATAAVQGRASELRLSLLRLTAEVRQFPLRIGGDASRDDLIAPRLPASFATVEPDLSTGGDAPPLALIIAGSDATPSQVVIGLRQGRRLTWPTALPFAEGDAVCVQSPCEHDGAAWSVLRGRILVPADWRNGEVVARLEPAAGPAMPERKTLLAFGGVNDWTPVQAIHPLRDFFPRVGDISAGGVLTDCDRWLCVGKGAARAPARSFLFQQGGFGGSAWAIILADPGARMARGGRVMPYAPPRAIPLGSGIRAEIFEPRFVDGVLDGPEARRGRLQLRRSLTLAERDGQAEITFPTPPTEIVGRCERGVAPRRLGLETAVVGGLTADALRQAPTAPQGPACAGFTHAKLDAPAAGPALRTAHLALDRLTAPWPAVLIALAWTASLLFSRLELFHRRPVLWTVLGLLQLLLALRLLIGLAAAEADPTLDWREILGDAAVAYVVVPAALLTWARAGEGRKAGDLALDLAPPLATLATFAWTHRISVLTLLLLAAWSAAVLWRAASAPPVKGAVPSPLGLLADQWRRITFKPGSPWLSGILLLVLVLVMRLAVGAVGWKERIDLGVTVLAISVVYTPLILIGFGRLLAASESHPTGWIRPIVFWTLLALATFIVPFTVRDSGYALMFLPIAGVAAGLAWRRRVARLPWAAPAAAAMAALLVLPILGAVGGAHADRLGQTAEMRRGLSDEQALATLDRQAKASQNLLRLYLIAAPEALGADVSTEAEGLKVWSAQLSDYTGSLFGRGYLSAANLTALKPVQATDNLTAVHLMSPFGRLATGLFLALLASAPIAVWSLVRSSARSVALDARRASGLLALWCLFGAAAYMTLANLQLVPFTGRNAYLLAPTSGGDLLEGAILVALAIWGLAERPLEAKR